MATPAENLESAAIALSQIASFASDISTNITESLRHLSAISSKMAEDKSATDPTRSGNESKFDSEQNSRLIEAIHSSGESIVNAIGNLIQTTISQASKLDMTAKVAANGLYQQLAKVNNNVVGVMQAVSNTSKSSSGNIEGKIDTANNNLLTIDSSISALDTTTKVAANNIYQQLARVNNRIASAVLSLGSAISLVGVEDRLDTVISSVLTVDDSISTLNTTTQTASNAIYQQIASASNAVVGVIKSLPYSQIISGLNEIKIAISSLTLTSGTSAPVDLSPLVASLSQIAGLITTLNATLISVGASIVSQIQNIPAIAAGTSTVDVTGIESRLDVISNARMPLLASRLATINGTLVTIGSNIVNQIKATPPINLGSLTINVAGVESRLDTVIDRLIDIYGIMDVTNATIMDGIEVNDARNLGTQDILVSKLGELVEKMRPRKAEQEFKGGRKEMPALAPFLDSLKGGIITATLEGGKQLVNVFNAVKTAASTGGAVGVAGAAVGAAAAMPAALGSVVEMISKFVAALDPAVMQQFQLVISDLMATIGIGLRPLFQAMIPIVRAFANSLRPVMEALAPVMQQLANTIIDIAVPYILIWAENLMNMIPVIESIIPLFVDLADMLTALTPTLTFVFDMFTRGLLLAIGVFYTLMTAIKTVIAGILDAGAWLVSWVSKSKSESMKSMANAMRLSADKSAAAAAKAFEKAVTPKKEKTFGKQAPTDAMAAKTASYTGIGDLGKNLMQAAFGSSAQEAAMNTANNTKRIADRMDQLVNKMGGPARGERNAAGVRR